jgi:hypothetical protein
MTNDKEGAMSNAACFPSRRKFLRGSAAVAFMSGNAAMLPGFAQAGDADTANIVGPKPGYSPQIGTLVSMPTWMRAAVLSFPKGLTQADLDHLFDSNANTIGALLLHLAATETYYQLNTFDGMKWDSWSNEVKQKWDPAMNLGDAGRKAIKGHDLDYYLNILKETREKSLAEFRNCQWQSELHECRVRAMSHADLDYWNLQHSARSQSRKRKSFF